MSIEKIVIACHKLQHSGGMERYVVDLINGFAEVDLSQVIRQVLSVEFCLLKNVHSLLNYDFLVKNHCRQILNCLDEFGISIV